LEKTIYFLDEIDDLLFEGGFDDALISHSDSRLIQIELGRNALPEVFENSC
tara:strand:+ start:1374 stop:1526 length:153 start_codon:yes stop_codon:yes gene_type:complete